MNLTNGKLWYVSVYDNIYDEYNVYKDCVFSDQSVALAICEDLKKENNKNFEYEVCNFYLNKIDKPKKTI